LLRTAGQPASGPKPLAPVAGLLGSLLLLNQSLTRTEPPRATGAQIRESDSPSLPRAEPGDFDPLIEEASRRFGVARPLIKAVIKAESDFNPQARSPSGATGLMQLLPSTAKDLGVTDLYDPRQNVMGGTRYLAMLLNRYRGDIESALAAYNWGPGNLERSRGRIPAETKQYVHRVMKHLDTLST
ncbi:MAG: lytic transglycosylase domain-containing protein, partial [Deltaproteobacteria bacterium]|nr:lytic transglycosylase domain-containing protein [Deltaproteobacteria bacterium]